MVELLLHHGANVEILDKEGRTPLHKAVGVAHTEAVRRLVRCGVDLSCKDDSGRLFLLPLFGIESIFFVKMILEGDYSCPCLVLS